MDLTPYLDHLQRELDLAAAAGGDDARALAERLTGPLESGFRLALLDALSAAADEITRELAPGSVDVRLRGRDPEFVVTPAPTAGPAGPAPDEAEVRPAPDATDGPGLPPVEGDDGATARITLRIPEHLKVGVDQAAAREHLSVNAWLVRAIAATLDPVDRRAGGRTTTTGGQRLTGWVR